jgi:GNAT superfamily N-acetyltransferase
MAFRDGMAASWFDLALREAGLMTRRPEMPPIETREFEPAMWPALEKLFGANGACGGCWCMFWRLEKGESYHDVKGPLAKRRFKAMAARGDVHGILAFCDGEPVGWCAFERRVDFPRLDRAPSLKVLDAERVWSLPCFFVKPGWRGKGVATAMLRAAERALVRHGAKIAEAYPVKPAARVPAAFAYTGVTSMFEEAGFEVAAARPKGKQRYRKTLRRA